MPRSRAFLEALNSMKMTPLYIILVLLVGFPLSAEGRTISSDTVWSGDVSVTEDLLIPEGVTLIISPGTVVRVSSSESTKTDPEYMSPLAEITVRGTLRAGGKGGSPVTFRIAEESEAGDWSGILVDGGSVVLDSCRIQDAESGVYLVKGSVHMKDSVVTENRYGIVAHRDDTDLRIESTKISENDYGIFLFDGAVFSRKDSKITGNRKKDIYAPKHDKYSPAIRLYKPVQRDRSRREYGEEVLLHETVWKGLVEIDGIIRVSDLARLIILPGTVVEFKKKDTNGDGIGENGLIIQGVIIAKGTKDNPIIFRSAEGEKRAGDWDSINIMGSDGTQNLFEFVQIEDAYRGLHFHFSNVALKGSVLRNNYRGVQFQESTVEISDTYFYRNKSGLQGRDSEVVFMDNVVSDNYFGIYIFRVNGIVRGNKIVNNYREGLRFREGIPLVTENLIDGNRFGIRVSDGVYGNFLKNIITHNLESGISLRGTGTIEISKNFFQGNGLYGISIQSSKALISGNQIAENRERGIGIVQAFEGAITGNNIVDNGMYAIDHEGTSDISAPGNFWGDVPVDEVVYDKRDDPARGRVNHEEPNRGAISFLWPMDAVFRDTAWYGDLRIDNTVLVPPSVKLRILPDSRLTFEKDAGLKVYGMIEAKGEKDARILFTSSAGGEDNYWNEINLEQAVGIFSFCDVEHAIMGIHSHVSRLEVTGCSFINNDSGMRFRGGPVEIRHSLFEANAMGLGTFLADATISGNSIRKNRIGIFVREEKGGGLTIRENNIFDNSRFNIRIGDFNRKKDVDARDNWWGPGDPSDTLFDEKNEPDIGYVIYEPYAREPFKLDIPVFDRKDKN
jgi:parallel beta-helix repeat protein